MVGEWLHTKGQRARRQRICIEEWNGKVVRLKSGGPKMTVSGRGEGGGLRLLWFVGLDLHTGCSWPDALEEVAAAAPDQVPKP